MFLFKQLAEKEHRENKGQLPDFITVDEGHFFEIWTLGNVLNYETRWSPNTNILKEIADHFHLTFYHEFAEPMNGVYGKVHYADGVLAYIGKTLKV